MRGRKKKQQPTNTSGCQHHEVIDDDLIGRCVFCGATKNYRAIQESVGILVRMDKRRGRRPFPSRPAIRQTNLMSKRGIHPRGRTE